MKGRRERRKSERRVDFSSPVRRLHCFPFKYWPLHNNPIGLLVATLDCPTRHHHETGQVRRLWPQDCGHWQELHVSVELHLRKVAVLCFEPGSEPGHQTCLPFACSCWPATCSLLTTCSLINMLLFVLSSIDSLCTLDRRAHVKEMGGDLKPDSPLIFLKPTTSFVVEGKPIQVCKLIGLMYLLTENRHVLIIFWMMQ